MILDELTLSQKESLSNLLREAFSVYYMRVRDGYLFGEFHRDDYGFIHSREYLMFDEVVSEGVFLKEYLKVHKRKDLCKGDRTPAFIEHFRVVSSCFILSLPLSDMLLYLNSFVTPVRSLVKWRLKEGV